ncbi:MAG: hypothetical protein PHD51_04070 [Patescibacteria group bacterium]|nr:hypothetical protein [Patescibacteria group bacterium]MDD5490803.1 hypothetical protein [Patescibacteria group bacterium]
MVIIIVRQDAPSFDGVSATLRDLAVPPEVSGVRNLPAGPLRHSGSEASRQAIDPRFTRPPA